MFCFGLARGVYPGRKELQVPPLRSPGFPVEPRAFDDLHVSLSTESRKRGLS
jgi:hypothetical protein